MSQTHLSGFSSIPYLSFVSNTVQIFPKFSQERPAKVFSSKWSPFYFQFSLFSIFNSQLCDLWSISQLNWMLVQFSTVASRRQWACRPDRVIVPVINRQTSRISTGFHFKEWISGREMSVIVAGWRQNQIKRLRFSFEFDENFILCNFLNWLDQFNLLLGFQKLPGLRMELNVKWKLWRHPPSCIEIEGILDEKLPLLSRES